ncbi:MAG: acyl-CoA dehydrogenase family protein, partial [Actinomycetota bacterium]|nr:acyl-CoA dehydrogenase family protein [Actinomycetota bacterium]
MTDNDIRRRVAEIVEKYGSGDRRSFLAARFDAGLAWVHFPPGSGGLGLPRTVQITVEEQFARLGAPSTAQADNVIGYGMAAPTILEFGTDEQRNTLLRPIFTAEEVWCQLFSEPGAGSDLAAVATRALRDGGDWVVTGQKVWTS